MAEKLARYREMRDFAKTAEPSGSDDVTPSKRLRFVIQKHAATRLHYDFRLELDGVFKSWAVTRGPSRDPADKRLAVATEDHPLGYGDFEGTIPKGEYGGGSVMLWDRGYWAPEPGFDSEKALKKGELKFVLEGERLHGSWVLVRMKRDKTGGKRENWLLIKHRDEAAVEGDDLLKSADTSVASGRAMDAIAAGTGKGPRPFMRGKAKAAAPADDVWETRPKGEPAKAAKPAAKTKAKPAATKAEPKTTAALPGFIEPQLCKSVDRPPSGKGWAHEIKFDGYRLQLRVKDGKATLKTRKGLDWTEKFQAIADPATAPDPQRVWIVTTGNPLNRYGGTQRDRAAAIPAVQPYRHLDVVNQYDSVADRPARWGWYSQRELSLSRHLAYDEVDINAPENLVYRDGNTTYMLVPAKELRQLRGLRFLRDIGWVTPERYDELDAERRTRIEADYDRPAYIEQGPGADWGNGVEPEVLREQEIDDAELRSVDDAVQDDAATAEQVVDDSPRRNGVPSEPDPDSLDSDLQLADDGPGEGDDSEASDSDDARGGEAGVRERVDSGVEAAGDGDQDTPGDTSDSADSEGGGGDE